MYIFKEYENAIIKSLDNTLKVYPSKWILLDSTINTNSEVVRLCSSRIFEVNNTGSQGSLIYKQQTQLGTYVGSGDINFLSHIDKDNSSYFDIDVYVSYKDLIKINELKSPVPTGGSLFIENQLNNPNIITIDTEKVIKFNLIVLLASTYDFEGNLIEEDIPLGIELLPQQQIIVSSPILGGLGTNWNMHFLVTIGNQKHLDFIETNSSQNLNSLIEKLSNLIAAYENNIFNNQTDKFDIIKAYMDEFRNSRTINVPYIINDKWYVNGRYQGTVDSIGGGSSGGDVEIKVAENDMVIDGTIVKKGDIYYK